MQQRSEQIQNLRVGIALAVLVVFSFSQTRTFDFVNYDDPDYVLENPAVASGLTPQSLAWAFTAFHAGNWHPLTWISHMADVALFGNSPGGHHLVNGLIHLFNTWLVFAVFQRNTGRLWAAGFLAAFFAIHPLHVESVAWISERKDLLSGFFGLGALLCYGEFVRSKGRPVPWYLCSLILLALGLLSKPMLVTWPFVLLLFDVWPLRRWTSGWFPSRKLVLEKMPFLIASAGSSIVTFLAQRKGGAVHSLETLSLVERLSNAVVAYVRYILKILWPVDLAAFYPHPGAWPALIVLSCFLILGIVSVIAFLHVQRRGWFFWGWFFFLGTLVPVIGLIQVGSQSMADRYTYLPAIGVFVAIIWGISQMVESRPKLGRPAVALGILVVLLLAQMSRIQASYWKDSVTLFRRVEAVNPRHHIIELYLGNALFKAGQSEEALMHLRAAVELKPDFPQARSSLAYAYTLLGRPADAVQEYRKALEFAPGFHQAMNNLAWLLATSPDNPQENGEEAIRWAARACELVQNSEPSYLGTLAAAYAQSGQFDRAIQTATQAMELAAQRGDRSLEDANRRLLELYRNNQPVRQ